MPLKPISAREFFHKACEDSARALDQSQHLLEAYFSQTPLPPFLRKMTLTQECLAISELKSEELEPVLVLPLSPALKFQKITLPQEFNSKTSLSQGIAFINDRQEITRIYLQYPALLDLWLLRLSHLLNRTGFHEEFKSVARIGKGSTSTVHKVQRLSDGKLLAAKVFLKSYLESKPERKESALNQIAFLRAMEHRNILKIHSVYESTSALFVVTDLLEGGTLIERVNAVRGLGVEEVRQVMAGIAEGLSYMHSMGVMHRDIKLENIMFSSPESLEPVIVDLGLAAISEEEPYIFYRCGTPGYIAPEIINMEGNQTIKVGCDVFSAGVIFHILLTNRFLFQGADNLEVYRNNKSLNFDLEGEEYDQYDPQAMDLLRSMLEVDEECRITAQEALLHDFLSSVAKADSKESQVSPAATAPGEWYSF